jgi:hypothetical protein
MAARAARLLGFIQTVVNVVLGGGLARVLRLALTTASYAPRSCGYAAVSAVRRECIGMIETFRCELIGCNISCFAVP